MMAGQVTQVGLAARAQVAYAVSGQRGSVRVFEVPSGRTLYYAETPYVDYPSASLDAEGRTLAVTVVELTPAPVHKIIVLEVRTGRRIADLVLEAKHLAPQAQGSMQALAAHLLMPKVLPVSWDALGISPKGDVVLAADQQYGLFAWSVKTLQPIWLSPRTPGSGQPTKIAWLPDATRAVLFEVAATGGTPCLLDTRTGKVLMQFEPRSGHGAVSGDGSLLLGVGNGQLAIWKPPTPAAVRELPIEEVPYQPSDGALAADGSRAFIGGGSQLIREIDLASGKVMRTLGGHLAGVSAVAASADGRHVLSGSVDGAVRLWDLASGRELVPPDALSGGVLALSIATDGARVATVGADSVVRTFQLDGTPSQVVASALLPAQAKPAHSAVIGAKAGRLALASPDRILYRELETGRERWQQTFQNTGLSVLDIDPRGNVLASLGTTLSVLEAQDGRVRFRSERGWVGAARFSSDGEQIAWSSHGGELEVLSSRDGSILARLAGHRGPVLEGDSTGRSKLAMNAPIGASALAFSPDRRLLASASDRELAIWELPLGTRTWRTDREYSMRAVLEFSPDGRWLALGDDNGVLSVVDLRTRSVDVLRLSATTLRNQEAAIATLAFLPSPGRLLVATRGGGLHEIAIERALPP